MRFYSFCKPFIYQNRFIISLQVIIFIDKTPSATRGAFTFQHIPPRMKNIFLYFITLLNLILIFPSAAQERLLSPKETIENVVNGVKTTIVYCRPSARGRKMVGQKDPYGQVWRTGANEATTIEFNKDVKIEGKDLPEGKYALFTIPGEKEWVIIFNKVTDQWGAYDYHQKEDALRVKVKSLATKKFVETFTIKPEKDRISLVWENFYVAFRISGK
jgi:hypothetical protein